MKHTPRSAKGVIILILIIALCLIGQKAASAAVCNGTSSIGDFVWYDANRNGLQDPGEPGLGGVHVTLKDSSGNIKATAVTAVDGSYSFAALCSGTYTVEIETPVGYMPTTGLAGDFSIDSNTSPTTVSLPSRTSDPTIDFGFTLPCAGSIGDFVWKDLNRNGIQDANEPGIANVTVNLPDASGAPRATTQTDVNGYYHFNEVCAGDYTVAVDESTVPEGLSPTIGNNNPAAVNLPTDDTSIDTVDFGYKPPCTGKIGDFVWHDLNRNGIQDSDEPGIDGVTVRLRDGSGIDRSVVTGAGPGGQHGYYQFSQLCGGDYLVSLDETTLPVGFTPSAPNVTGGTTADDSNQNPATVSLATDDSSDSTIDFGFESPCTGTIGDFIWYDQNLNGIQDSTEPGIDGVTVNLLNTKGEIVASAVTASGSQQGFYKFTGVCPGDYTVRVDETTLLARGFAPSMDAAPGSTPANDSSYSPVSVALSEAESNQTIDFGYIHPCTGEIGDFVWHDLNRDGIQDDNEPGIDGVLVKLKDSSGSIVDKTYTKPGPMGSHGYYRFGGLCAGAYILEVDATTLPSGFSATAVNSPEATPSTDSNATPATVVLDTDDSSVLTIDFGFVNPCSGTIGDFVWQDLNHNGIQDAGEPGIDGVTVKLKNSGGSVAGNTTTGIGPDGRHGYYRFTGVCAGNYTVEAASPAGFLPATPNAGTDEAIDSGTSPATVSLPTDESSEQSIDFGYVSPCTGKIGNFVWYDGNGNGLQSPREQGIDGVTLKLKDPSGTILATTTSGSGPCGYRGYYQFTGVCAGTYMVEAVTPSGYKPTVSDAGRNNLIDSDGSPEAVVLRADNSTVCSVDFGFVMRPQPGCGTPGYWKNHPESWPVCQITIGGVTYTKKQAIALMKVCNSKDKTYSMFEALVSAKLNVMIGNKSYCIDQTIAGADAWMARYGPVGSGVRAGTTCSPWKTGEPLQKQLDAYNNGLLCAPSRDCIKR